MQKIQFDYFTGMEAEQYSFLSCPESAVYRTMLLKLFLVKRRYYTV